MDEMWNLWSRTIAQLLITSLEQSSKMLNCKSFAMLFQFSLIFCAVLWDDYEQK